MENKLKHNWINVLGMLFLFTAFLYFLKMIVDSGLFPPQARAASGLLFGVSAIFVGVSKYKKGQFYLSEIISGLGIAIIYATLAYVSFNNTFLWSANALFISMITASVLAGYVAIKYEMRILYLLSTLGGLLTPLILKADSSQDFMLFIYLLVINIAALYVSVVKCWSEIKFISFASTLLLYVTYYFLFDPIYWLRPFIYVLAFFMIYLIGSVLDQINKKENSLGADVYLSLINAINFVFWTNYIFSNLYASHLFPLIIVGVSFIAIGIYLFYSHSKQLSVINASYLALGLIVIAIASSDMAVFLSGGTNYVVNSWIWIVLILSAFIFAKQNNNKHILYGTYFGFLFITIYWYSVAWDVEWVSIFGVKYIPFINMGAFVWLGLAFLGFYFAKYEMAIKPNEFEIKSNSLSTYLALLSHIIIGGLLTVQITNLWEAYNIILFNKNLALSICWMVYALIIYLWSNYSRNTIFKGIGSVVLILTSLKVFFWDLSGSASVQKVIFLVVVGTITLFIGKVNNKIEE